MGIVASLFGAHTRAPNSTQPKKKKPKRTRKEKKPVSAMIFVPRHFLWCHCCCCCFCRLIFANEIQTHTRARTHILTNRVTFYYRKKKKFGMMPLSSPLTRSYHTSSYIYNLIECNCIGKSHPVGNIDGPRTARSMHCQAIRILPITIIIV